MGRFVKALEKLADQIVKEDLAATPRTNAMLVKLGQAGSKARFVEFTRGLERQNRSLIAALEKIHNRSWPTGDLSAGANHAIDMAAIADEALNRLDSSPD